MTPLLTAALAGLGFGLSLIVAIGAQNAYVLRQGLRKEHVFVIVAICALSDAALIAVGVAGLGAVIQQLEWLLLLIEVIGGVFLCTYGVMAAKRAWKPEVLNTDTGGKAVSLKVAAGTALALTYLNPHVYLDTVLLLGSVAGTYEANRWWFAAGAMLFVVVEELIPESQQGRHTDLATAFTLIGFAVMMVMDVALG